MVSFTHEAGHGNPSAWTFQTRAGKQWSQVCALIDHSPYGVGTISLCVTVCERVCVYEIEKMKGKRGCIKRREGSESSDPPRTAQTSIQTIALVLIHTVPQATHETAAPHYSWRERGGPMGGPVRTETLQWSNSTANSETDTCQTLKDKRRLFVTKPKLNLNMPTGCSDGCQSVARWLLNSASQKISLSFSSQDVAQAPPLFTSWYKKMIINVKRKALWEGQEDLGNYSKTNAEIISKLLPPKVSLA